MMMTAPTQTQDPTQLTGGRLVSSDGRELPLQGVDLTAEAGGGIARVVLTQRFVNPTEAALEVRYLVPLPSDGAVSGFSFTLAGKRIEGEVTGKQQARERFERALVAGQTAALLEQDRSSLFTQRVGNVPPGAEILCELVIDQPLRWLEEGCWEWRFPTVVGARYQGEPGRVADAGKLSVPVAAGGTSLRATLRLDLLDAATGAPVSPSHALEPTREGALRFEGGAGVRLDRDVVVRWPVALPDVSANVLATRPARASHGGDTFALLTVAPPCGGGLALARDLTFLIDTSGSMGGRPLQQAAEVLSAMIETLGPEDRLELIEFGSAPKRWRPDPVAATSVNKAAAILWVHALRASGCTEMHRAVLEALRPLRPNTQRQVVLVTDGYIGFEQEIVATLLRELPDGARLHTVGVGSSVNRTLTQGAARAGRGTELILGLDEDPAPLAARLLARTSAPLVTDLRVSGPGVQEVAPRQIPDLYAETPALFAVRLGPEGGAVTLRGQSANGPWEQTLLVPPLGLGEGPSGVAALFGREKVEDLEMSLSGGARAAEVDAAIEATGVDFQIATRLTSWVAVSKAITIAQGTPRSELEQPHELPYGVSAEGLGLRPAASPGAPPMTQTGTFAPYPTSAPAPAAGSRRAQESSAASRPARALWGKKRKEASKSESQADAKERRSDRGGEPAKPSAPSEQAERADMGGGGEPLGLDEAKRAYEAGDLSLEEVSDLLPGDGLRDLKMELRGIQRVASANDIQLDFEGDPATPEPLDPNQTGEFAASDPPSGEYTVVEEEEDLDGRQQAARASSIDDASLVEVGSDEDMVHESFELMDEERPQFAAQRAVSRAVPLKAGRGRASGAPSRAPSAPSPSERRGLIARLIMVLVAIVIVSALLVWILSLQGVFSTALPPSGSPHSSPSSSPQPGVGPR